MSQDVGFEPLETVDMPGGYVEVTDPEQAAELLNQFSAEATPGTERVGHYPTPEEIAASTPQHVAGGEQPTDRQAPYRVIQVDDIEPPPSPEVRLPGGYLQTDGNVVDTVQVRELTGEDEEAIARAGATGNFFRLAQAYLDAGVTHVGEQRASAKLLKSLMIGDRDFLLLAIRRATYGDVITFDEFLCPVCKEEYEVKYDLSKDVPIKTVDIDPEHPLFEVPLRRGGVAVCTVPTGFDQEEVYNLTQKMKTKSMGEVTIAQNTILVSRCVNYIKDTNGDVRMTYESARMMGSADRKAILKALFDAQPGPQYDEVKFECKECGSVTPVPLGLADLFRGE